MSAAKRRPTSARAAVALSSSSPITPAASHTPPPPPPLTREHLQCLDLVEFIEHLDALSSFKITPSGARMPTFRRWAQQLHDQWFARASELEGVPGDALLQCQLPRPLVQAIETFFVRLRVREASGSHADASPLAAEFVAAAADAVVAAESSEVRQRCCLFGYLSNLP